MPHPLDGPRAKIARAEHHLLELERKRRVWIETHPYAIARQPQPEPHTYAFTLLELSDPPDHLGLIVGDIVHNLRSALDHLAWQLVTTANGKKASKVNRAEIFFPVGTSLSDFISKSVLRHLTWEQIAVIEGFQPYRGGDAPNPLRDLHNFWNLDKHCEILAVPVRISDQGPTFELVDAVIEDRWIDRKVPLKQNAKIACVRLAPKGPKPDVQVSELPIDVGFGERGRLIQDVPTMRDLTRDVVERCAQFFD